MEVMKRPAKILLQQIIYNRIFSIRRNPREKGEVQGEAGEGPEVQLNHVG